MEVDGIDPARIPTHIAAVMDGNGRWATQRGLKRTAGHAAGEEALLDAVEGALELGVKWFTVYAFSTENWRRPADEVRYLMDFNESLLLRRRDELNDRDVRMRFIGRRNRPVPKRIIQRMDESVALTEKNRTMTLTIAFNYGGRAEIVDAVRALVAEGAKPRQITEKAIHNKLYDPDMPDPDLWIRTSGEHRIS
ncbi:MAG TPA: polyprenyl diphosphate synthase, partial [Acidimicrobiales bacterium]